jgi:hypothetical protein
MDDADITALAEQVGLESPIAEVVAWARQRTDDLLAEGLDADLAGLLEGRSVVVEPSERAAPPARTGTQPGVPRPAPIEVQRMPLPPVPQRPDLAAHPPHDSADDLEMLDEDDLELVEDLGDGEGSDSDDGDSDDGHRDGSGDAGAGGEPLDRGPAVSSPEWKRALADAQGE